MKKPDVIREQGALLFLDGQFALRYEDDGRAVIKLVSPASVRAAFSHILIDSVWLSNNVVRWGHSARGEYVVLWFPSQRYRLQLINDFGERFLQQPVVAVDVSLPALVFVGHGQSYHVWALRQPGFAPTAEVCHAPLPNVQLDGSICFGGNHPPTASTHTMMTAWQMFIASPFNGHLAGGKSNAYPADVREQLLWLADRRALRYPQKDLQTIHGTLGNVVERTIQRMEHGR